MSALQVLGLLLLVFPFVVIAGVSVRTIGWHLTGALFGGVAAFAAVALLGSWLVTGGAS